MECRDLLKPDNLERLIMQLARHEFITKILGALYGMSGGVHVAHHPFWEGGVREPYVW